MIEYFLSYVFPAAYSLLPPEMASSEATALLTSIALQESRFEFRRQIGGPARSFLMFELNGIKGVLSHADSADPIADVLRRLRYQNATPNDLLAAVEHNDVLAACFARCLLWTLPNRLPRASEGREAYQQYISAWGPGKPRPDSWTTNYAVAWGAVMQHGRVTHV